MKSNHSVVFKLLLVKVRERVLVTVIGFNRLEMAVVSLKMAGTYITFKKNESLNSEPTHRLHFSRIVPHIDIGMLQGFIH